MEPPDAVEMERLLGEFVRDARAGALPDRLLMFEGRLWRGLIELGWSEDDPDGTARKRAAEQLATVPEEALSGPGRSDDEPVIDLERAMAAVAVDARERPRLWRALYDGEVAVPVTSVGTRSAQGVAVRFLSSRLGDAPVVFGFSSEARLAAGLRAGWKAGWVVLPGRDLARVWPAGHWLALNPGTVDCVVVRPWEITGLPHGAGMKLPHPDAVHIEPPDDADERLAVLVSAVAATPEVEHLHWARVRAKAADNAAQWRHVVVVTASSRRPDAEATAVHALTASEAATQLPGMLVVARQADVGHPFVDAVVVRGVRV